MERRQKFTGIIALAIMLAILPTGQSWLWSRTNAKFQNINPLIPSYISESVDTFVLNGDFLDVKTLKDLYKLDKNTGEVADFKRIFESQPGYCIGDELLISTRVFELGDGYALYVDKTNPENPSLVCLRNNKLLWRKKGYPVEFFTPFRIHGDYAFASFGSFQGIFDLSNGELVKRFDEKMNDSRLQSISGKTASVPVKMVMFDQDVTIAMMSVLKNGTWEKLWDLQNSLGWPMSIQKDTIQICKSSGMYSNKAGTITIFDKMSGKQIEQIKPSKIFPNSIFFDLNGYIGGVVYGMAYDENVREAYLYAFDIKTNDTIFEYPLATRVFTDTTIENDEDSIYAVLKSGLSRINLSDGKIVWSFPTSQDNHYYDYNGAVYCNGFETQSKETFENVQIRNDDGFAKLFTSPEPTRNTSCQTLFPIGNDLFLYLPYTLGKSSMPRIIGSSGVVCEFSLDMDKPCSGRLAVRNGDKFFIACGDEGYFLDTKKRNISKKIELKRGDYFSKHERHHLIGNDKWIVEGLTANSMINVISWQDEKIRSIPKNAPFYLYLAGDYCAFDVSEEKIVAVNLADGSEKTVEGKIISVLGRSFLVKKDGALCQWNPETDSYLEMDMSGNPSYLKYLFAEGVDKPIMPLPAIAGEMPSSVGNKYYLSNRLGFMEFDACPSYFVQIELKSGVYCVKVANVSQDESKPLSLRIFPFAKAQAKSFVDLDKPFAIGSLAQGESLMFDVASGCNDMILFESNGLLDVAASSGFKEKNILFDGYCSTVDSHKSFVFIELGN